MIEDESYASWLRERQQGEVPAGFADRAMGAIHAARAQRTPMSALALAAGVLLVAMGHAATIGMLLCTLTGVAQ
jgi:hypothetical protein